MLSTTTSANKMGLFFLGFVFPGCWSWALRNPADGFSLLGPTSEHHEHQRGPGGGVGGTGLGAREGREAGGGRVVGS